jgi:hypothetical protein
VLTGAESVAVIGDPLPDRASARVSHWSGSHTARMRWEAIGRRGE